MKLSTANLKRYKEIIALLWKYGRTDLARQMNLAGDDFEFKELKIPRGQADPMQLADDLEAMGATYVKLGQLLSSRSDIKAPGEGAPGLQA